MSKTLFAIGAVLILSFLSSCKCPETTPLQVSTPQPDLNIAVQTALARLAALGKPLNEFKLISAKQIVFEGKYIWFITFKPIRLLPSDPATELVGAGGEIFVKVDIQTGETVVTYGE